MHLSFVCSLLCLLLGIPFTHGFIVSDIHRRKFERGKNGPSSPRRRRGVVVGKQSFLTCTSRQEENSDSTATSNRRNFFAIFSMIPILSLSLPNDAHTIDSQNETQQVRRKPWAPLEALLPATRVRILIQKSLQYAMELDTSLQQDPIEISKLNEIFQNLSQILAPPLQNQDIKPNKSIQIAFDTYTSYLRYDDTYTLNVSPPQKSKMIRQDLLPDVKQVIQSDLDLRDLYRNAVMSHVDDARAELRYLIGLWDAYLLKKERDDDLNAKELVTLLQDANSVCDDWFHLISEDDVNDALTTLLDMESNNNRE